MDFIAHLLFLVDQEEDGASSLYAKSLVYLLDGHQSHTLESASTTYL